jgi:hypothetical protein
VLRDVAAIRRRVRADRHALSGPLLVLGAVAVCGALLQLGDELRLRALDAPGGLVSTGWVEGVYWPLAVPLGFAALTVLERWQWRRRGVSGGGRRYGWIAVALLVALVVPFAWLAVELGGPYLLIGGGLAAAGMLQRHRPLAIAGAVIGTVGTSEAFFWITNRLPASLWRPWAHDAIYVGVAVLMVAAGLAALHRERATR